jgi:predicted DNA-binding transcriptional regulator AlpA
MPELTMTTPENPLGQPISIRQVAAMLGCSPWTVRYRHIPAGLPHFRATASGRLVFYTGDVIRWIKSKTERRVGR